jgi:hypothetical protein
MQISGAFEIDQDLFALSLLALTIKVMTVTKKKGKKTIIRGDTSILKTIERESQLSVAALPKISLSPPAT